MHRLIQDRLEEVLRETGRVESGPAAAHLSECQECREEVSAMRRQATNIRTLRANDDTLAPRAGFYARVMERIESQRPIDIWQLFFDSTFARRIAMASMAMAVLFSLYLVSSERLAKPIVVGVEQSQPGMILTKTGLPDKDAVLVNLVTYREQ